MADPTPEILAELNTLLRLTQTEAMIAQTRRAQATTDRIERELRQNAGKCEERARLLANAINDLGGIPDVVGAAFGRASANAKAVLEQGQTPAEAFLGDLALEHQLRDRALYVKMLAQSGKNQRIVKLMERLDEAHTATIEWIETRLGELAVGGPTALAPSPTQVAMGFVQQVAFFPTRQYAEFLNRVVASVRSLRSEATETVESGAGRARQVAGAALRILATGRNATLERTEEEASKAGADKTADRLHETRRNLGALSADELPIKGYDKLTVSAATAAIRRLNKPEDVRAILAYEGANKDRQSVLEAGQTRLEDIVNRMAAAS
jgi:bacterioferritin (cytochrome b1)